MEDKKVNDLLDKLALKFNTTVEKLYAVMIKQVKVEAVKSCVMVFYLLLGGLILKYLWGNLDPQLVPGLQGDGSWPVQIIIKWTILFLISCAWFIVTAIKLVHATMEVINAWANPEGVAFNRILRYFN